LDRLSAILNQTEISGEVSYDH